ncbi:P27 family phage terminase small subunit [Treponema zuelzerae]|uniref:P27 family phage terminase small subunit n=1 Tax=Teretinema zuelzerae TaxID=156 RepID=A0AAE3EJ45_9SPIR|nr:P27 family phage terminase small subunit [Teretinema zuelzerae]MCD1654726.1 P27 family phage terminase small subunit [Teretinema zuelzerae]
MAPPRKTIQELKETGNYRPSRQGKRTEVQGTASDKIVISIPKSYDKVTAAEFKRVAGFLKKNGVLTVMDLTSLYEAFNVYAENQRVYTVLKETPVTSEIYKRLSTLYSTGVKTFNQIIKQFGAVPSERTKVSDLMNKKKVEKKNPLLEALKND